MVLLDRSLHEITQLTAPNDQALTAEQKALLEQQILQSSAGVSRLVT